MAADKGLPGLGWICGGPSSITFGSAVIEDGPPYPFAFLFALFHCFSLQNASQLLMRLLTFPMGFCAPRCVIVCVVDK